jgi:hypothetical protein
MYNDGLSPADVAVLSGNNGGNGNGGFGNGDGAWWIIIFLIFATMGWGRNGFGGGNGGNDGFNGFGGWGFSPCCAPATQQGVSDEFNFNQLDNGIRGVQNGLCDGFYAINSSISGLGASLLNCCCEVKGAIAENGWQTRDAINTNSNAIQGQLCNGFNGINQNINNLGYKLQDCCCETQRAIDGVNYNMAKNTCDIIRAGQDNTQRIIDYLTTNEITSLRTELQSAQLQLSQLSQTRTLIDEIKPCPIPAYITCNPYSGYPYGYTGFNNGCNANCGCC